jgi:hypothetical protein
MKKINICIVATMLLAFAGCNVKSSDDVRKENDEIIKKAEQNIDELTNFLYVGGQPGKITVKGIVVKNENSQTVLDERIKLEQIGGKGNRGVSQVMVSDKNKAVLLDVGDVKSLEKSAEAKTFINLGCKDLKPEDVAGLTEQAPIVSTETVLSLSVSKIFICGQQSISQNFVALSGNEIILRNAEIIMTGSVGSFSMSANKIYINGKNKFGTNGVESTISVMDGPSLDVIINQEIHGDGSLDLQTVGGNCVQKDEKK